MPNLTRDEILEILTAGNFDRLIGAVENEIMEAKGEPYHLDTRRGRFELAKDVSAFANARGGVLLIGARTERSALHQGDEIVAIRPFQQPLLNTQQYHDILNEWIYPPLSSVEIRWYPSQAAADTGIVAIVIPEQPQMDRPFLVGRSVDETDRQIDVLLGYAERRQSGTGTARVRDLHILLRDGRRFDEISRRLEGISEQLAQGTPTNPAPHVVHEPAITDAQLDERRGKLSTAAELRARPLFTLAAVPTPGLDFPGFLRQDSPLVRLLDIPPVLRSHGFDMNLSRPSELVAGQFRQVIARRRAALELSRDGVLLFVADAEGFLGWATSVEGGPLRINSLALCESAYSFACVSAAVYAGAAAYPESVRYVVSLHNLTIGGKRAQLNPGPIGPFGYRFVINPQDAPDSHVVRSTRWDGPAIHPGKVAFRMVREIYAWFGVDEGAVPYVSEVDGEHVVDPERIKQTSQ